MFKMRIRTESGTEYIATIIESIMNAAPCDPKGRIYGLIGATVEVTGTVSGHAISRPRGRVLALTPEMAAQFAIEQERDAEIKAASAKADAEFKAQWNREYGNARFNPINQRCVVDVRYGGRFRFPLFRCSSPITFSGMP